MPKMRVVYVGKDYVGLQKESTDAAIHAGGRPIIIGGTRYRQLLALAATTKTKVMKRMMRWRRSTVSGTAGMKVSGLVTSEGRSPPAGDLPPPLHSVPAAALFPAKTHQPPTDMYPDDVLYTFRSGNKNLLDRFDENPINWQILREW